jgi:hypothetical protein
MARRINLNRLRELDSFIEQSVSPSSHWIETIVSRNIARSPKPTGLDPEMSPLSNRQHQQRYSLYFKRAAELRQKITLANAI